MKELDAHIESTQTELNNALARLRSFAELQSSLDDASSGLKQGGLTLNNLGRELSNTSQDLSAAIGSFRDAVDAMREATPEALSNSINRVVTTTDKTERDTLSFHTQLKEELAEQRESMERRILAVESGLEQMRSNLTQLDKRVAEGFDESSAGVGRRHGWVTALVWIAILIGAANLALQIRPDLISMFTQ